MKNDNITNEMVINALSGVMDPELHQDLVTLKMVKDVVVNGGEISFTIELTTPACPLRNKIESDARQAVAALKGVTAVNINMSARVQSSGKSDSGQDHKIKNVVAIASGKGGVGKTTLAVNIAVSLAQTGACVGLLDADIYGPNIPIMMGVNQQPTADGDKLKPIEAFGVKLMSIGFLVEPGMPIIWRGPLLHKAIEQFINDVAWGELDYLIIDMPPGTGDVQISLAQTINLSGGVIVTLPQQVSVDDAMRGLEIFNKLNVPVLGVVENMSYLELPDGSRMDIFGEGGGVRMAEDANVPFIGSIPLDAGVRQGGDQGEPVVISDPDTASAKAMRSIAQIIAAKLSVAAANKMSG